MILFESLATLLLVLANGRFAMSEISVVTARQSRLAHRVAGVTGGPRAAAALKSEPTDFLSAVQIGITLVGILAGAFGGARLSIHSAESISRIGWIAPYAETVAFVRIVAIITFLSLIIGELVPKRIALANPEGVAMLVARPMQRLATITRPLVVLGGVCRHPPTDRLVVCIDMPLCYAVASDKGPPCCGCFPRVLRAKSTI
ncbi:MAG TPA: CNNM domain-containing protein [Gemmatimonadaceae bacterium]|nr:CNNM domain-containing protein [Gemmatimonadaceae bacterium]